MDTWIQSHGLGAFGRRIHSSSNVGAIRTPVFQPIRGRYSDFDGNRGL